MLQRCTYIITLNTIDNCCCSFTSQKRVLRVVLKVTTTKWVTHNINTRSKENIYTILLNLLAHSLTYTVDNLVVPSCSKVCTHWETCTVVCIRIALAYRLDTQSRRTICHNDRRNTQARYRICNTRCTRNNLLGIADLARTANLLNIGTHNKVCLLLKGHSLDNLIDIILSELQLLCRRCAIKECKCCNKYR